MASILPADPTLDEIRAALAPLIAEGAAFDGFGDTALADAARRLDIDVDVARLAFPGGGRDMVDAWFADIDAAMAGRCPAEKLPARKITRSEERRVCKESVSTGRSRWSTYH